MQINIYLIKIFKCKLYCMTINAINRHITYLNFSSILKSWIWKIFDFKTKTMIIKIE